MRLRGEALGQVDRAVRYGRRVISRITDSVNEEALREGRIFDTRRSWTFRTAEFYRVGIRDERSPDFHLDSPGSPPISRPAQTDTRWWYGAGWSKPRIQRFTEPRVNSAASVVPMSKMS
jgi:hypothetical protein